MALRLSAQLPDGYEDAVKVIREMERMLHQWEHDEVQWEHDEVVPTTYSTCGTLLPFPGPKSGV